MTISILYIRKSVVADPAKTLSPQVQEERLRALALSHGDPDPLVISDLDISGKEVEARPGYMEMVRRIQAGEVSNVYAWDLSRLHRNRVEAPRFFELAAKHDVTVYLTDMVLDPKTATGRMIIDNFTNINAWISEVASEKIRASIAKRRALGLPVGGRDHSDPQTVIDAYKTAGSYAGASRLLNESGAPTRNGKIGGWWPASVEGMVRKYRPDLYTPGNPGTKAGPRAFRLARLLECGTCGTLLTGSYDKKHQSVRYYCSRARGLKHQRVSVQESAIIGAIRKEAERLLPAGALRRSHSGGTAKADALAAKRARIVEAFLDGTLDKADRDERLHLVDAQLGAISDQRRVMTIRPTLTMAWGGDEEDIGAVNQALRSIWTSVLLDPQTMAPVTFQWRVPEWRG